MITSFYRRSWGGGVFVFSSPFSVFIFLMLKQFLNGFFDQIFICQIRNGDVVCSCMETVVLDRCFNGMVIPCPVPTSNSAHGIPGNGRLMISSIRWLPSRTRPNPPLMALPIPVPPPLWRATRLIPPSSVTSVTLNRHVTSDVRTIFDV